MWMAMGGAFLARRRANKRRRHQHLEERRATADHDTGGPGRNASLRMEGSGRIPMPSWRAHHPFARYGRLDSLRVPGGTRAVGDARDGPAVSRQNPAVEGLRQLGHQSRGHGRGGLPLRWRRGMPGGRFLPVK
ncbi:MAG TPA: hypothetical protein DEQ61_07770 [Streptomyces sp.]|nr:hypothetical protein [Streptomyces sp.]